MKHVKLSVEKRATSGTDACRALRRQGQLPAVVYGGKDSEGGPNREVTTLSVNQRDFETLIHSGVKFYDLQIGETLHIVATDPSTHRDFSNYCRFMGHELLRADVDGEVLQYWIKKVGA